MPIDLGSGLISFQFQGMDFAAGGFIIGDALLQTATGEDAELDLRHIQPTAVLGGVVELLPLGNASRLRRAKDILQRCWAMGVQVVQHQKDYRYLGVCFIHRPPHLVAEILGGTTFLHYYTPPILPRIAEQEQVAGTLPPVLIVLPPRAPRLDGQRISDVG